MESSRFGNLPAELRNRIYALVFDRGRIGFGKTLLVTDTGVRYPDPDLVEDPLTMKLWGGVPNFAFTRTCRQIYQESLGLAYSLIGASILVFIEEFDQIKFTNWATSLGDGLGLLGELSFVDNRILAEKFDGFEGSTRHVAETLVYLHRLSNEHGLKINIELGKYTFFCYNQGMNGFFLTIGQGLDVYDQFDDQIKQAHALVQSKSPIWASDLAYLRFVTRFNQTLRAYRDVHAEGCDADPDECWRRVRSIVPRLEYNFGF